MRALVISGGGAYGAFQVGVIKRLTELGKRWDIIAGVSVGAINALQMAMYPVSQQDTGARVLEQFWYDIKSNETVYRNWTIPILEGLLGKGGMFDTAPLESFLRARFKPELLSLSGVLLRLGATGLSSGQIVFGTEKSHDVVKWVMASAAFPGAFPPVEIDGEKWVDGGIRDTIPVEEAISLGATHIDIVMTNPQDGEALPWDLKHSGNAALVGIRAAEIMENEVFVTDQDCLKNFTGTYKVYAPYAPWDSDSLTFDPKIIRRMIDVGYGIP